MMKISPWACALTLLLADFFAEWLHEVPNYDNALMVSWYQFVAIMIYYFIWIRPELVDGKLR